MRVFAALARLEASILAPHAWERFVVRVRWKWVEWWPWIAPCVCGNRDARMVGRMAECPDGERRMDWHVECPCGQGDHQSASTERLMRASWDHSVRSKRHWLRKRTKSTIEV